MNNRVASSLTIRFTNNPFYNMKCKKKKKIILQYSNTIS